MGNQGRGEGGTDREHAELSGGAREPGVTTQIACTEEDLVTSHPPRRWLEKARRVLRTEELKSLVEEWGPQGRQRSSLSRKQHPLGPEPGEKTGEQRAGRRWRGH